MPACSEACIQDIGSIRSEHVEHLVQGHGAPTSQATAWLEGLKLVC